MRSLVKSWKKLSETEVGVNGSSLTWLLRELFTGLQLRLLQSLLMSISTALHSSPKKHQDAAEWS